MTTKVVPASRSLAARIAELEREVRDLEEAAVNKRRTLASLRGIEAREKATASRAPVGRVYRNTPNPGGNGDAR